MNEAQNPPPQPRALWLGSLLMALLGAGVMVYLQGPGLTSPSRYHIDLTQSPHWMAYHGQAFAEDDLLVEYATYNESPVQNAIYWVGTLLVDVVLLNKLVGIVIFGLTAALFFALVSWMSGPRVGTLAALFFMIFPRSTYEIAGGFSKAWAIGLVLIAIFVVERRAWRILLWILPLAALAYPVAAVMIGAIVAVGLVLLYPGETRESLRGLKFLAAGSALAQLPLLYKYATPPARIGEMISTAEMRHFWETGRSSSFTLPLSKEVLSYFPHPFFVYGAALLVILLFRRGMVWKQSWSAVVIASAIGYWVAHLVIPRLYLPDRYVRFSIAVLLVLWFAHNWALFLDIFKQRRVRHVALAALVVIAAASFSDTFRPCEGEKDHGLWQDQGRYQDLSRVIAALPSPVLVAGHPMSTAFFSVQARQPVLVIHRMFHPWFRDYYQAIDTRIRDTYRALYARNVAGVNELHERYGVTHIVVPKVTYIRSRRESGEVYKKFYDSFMAELAEDPFDFVLAPPPREAVLFEDDGFWLVHLPLADPDSEGRR